MAPQQDCFKFVVFVFSATMLCVCLCPQESGVRKESEASLDWGYQEIQDPRGHQVRTPYE